MPPDVEELQERIIQLEVALKGDDEAWARLGLSRTEAGIFGALMRLPVLTRGTMQLLVATQSDAVTENAETVVIYRMRKKLMRHGIEIATVHRGGYYLTPDMKDHVRGLQ